jgi:hypothetical protein
MTDEKLCYAYQHFAKFLDKETNAAFLDCISQRCLQWLVTLPNKTYVLPTMAQIKETSKMTASNHAFIVLTGAAGVEGEEGKLRDQSRRFYKWEKKGKSIRIIPSPRKDEYDEAGAMTAKLLAHTENGSTVIELTAGAFAPAPPAGTTHRAAAYTAVRAAREARPAAPTRSGRRALIGGADQPATAAAISGGGAADSDETVVNRNDIYNEYRENHPRHFAKGLAGDMFAFVSKTDPDTAGAILPLLTSDNDVNVELMLDFRADKQIQSMPHVREIPYLVPNELVKAFTKSEFYLRGDAYEIGGRQIASNRLESSVDIAAAASPSAAVTGGAGEFSIARLQMKPSEIVSLLYASDVSRSDLTGGAHQTFDEQASRITEARSHIQSLFTERKYTAALGEIDRFYNEFPSILPEKTASYIRKVTGGKDMPKYLARLDFIRYLVAKDKEDSRNPEVLSRDAATNLDLNAAGRSYSEVDRVFSKDRVEFVSHRLHNTELPSFSAVILANMVETDAFAFVRPPPGSEFHPLQFNDAIKFRSTVLS